MKIKKLLPYFLMILATALAYSNALENEFVWDDEFLIEKNSYLKSFSSFPKMLTSNSTAGFGGQDSFYRPTQNILYLFIYQMFGYDKVAFHLGNILIHLLNGFLIFLLALRMTKNQVTSLSAALLWLVHPTHVEAVTYISGTADPLSLLFCLASLLCFPLKGKNKTHYLFSFVFFALALMSKEAIIVTPALLCLLILYHDRGQFRWKSYLQSLPFWGLALFYMVLRKTWLNFDESFQFYKESNIYTENILYRAYTYFATLPDYLVILFRPTQLHMERDFPVHVSITQPVLLGILLFSLSLFISSFLFFKRKQFLPLFSWLWFFTAFIPMMGILLPVNSFILEHWLYIPSLGFFLVSAWLLQKSERFHPHLPKLLLLTLVGSSIYWTHERNKDWATPIKFYSNILKYSEGSARVHNNLAMAYSNQENWDLAISHYQKSISLSDRYPQTHYNLARAFARQQRYDLALSHLQRSLEIDPKFHYARTLQFEIKKFLNSLHQDN